MKLYMVLFICTNNMSKKSKANLSKPIDLSELCEGGTIFEFDPKEYFKDQNYLVDTFCDLSVTNDDYEDALAGDVNKGGPGTKLFQDIAKKMSNVQDNNLIKKRVLRQGSGPTVTNDVEIRFHYNAFWEGENIPFDSTYMRGVPQKILPNEDEVLPGIKLAVLSMKFREEALFLISYELLYGELGCPPRIRPKADALFMIEVIKICPFVQQPSTEETHMFPVVLKKVTALHAEGVTEYKMGRYGSAIRTFQKAVDILEKARMVNDIEEKKQQELLIKLYTNLAVGYNKEKKPYRACSMCNELTKLTNINKNTKILFQFGRALFAIKEYGSAKEKLLKALKIEPNNNEIKAELTRLETQAGEKSKDEIVLSSKEQPLDNNITREFMQEVKAILNIFLENETENELIFNGIYTTEEINYFRNTAKELNLKFEEVCSNNQRSYFFNK